MDDKHHGNLNSEEGAVSNVALDEELVIDENIQNGFIGNIIDKEKYVQDGFVDKLKNFAVKIPVAKDVVALYYSAIDPETPVSKKAIAISALAYFLLPVDAIPDIMPVVGFTDDISALVLAINQLSSFITDTHREKAALFFKTQNMDVGNAGQGNNRSLEYKVLSAKSLLELSYEKRIFIVNKDSNEAFLGKIEKVNQKDAKVLRVDFSDADNLMFPVNHPKANELYVAHPYKSGVYYPVRDYHASIMDDKRNELIYLLKSLGAKRVLIGAENEKSLEEKLSRKLNINNLFKSNLSKTRIKENRVSDVEEYCYENTSNTEIPGNLAWFNHEFEWQKIAQKRVGLGLKSYKFELVNKVSDETDIELDLKIKNVVKGLDIGTTLNRENKKLSVAKYSIDCEFY